MNPNIYRATVISIFKLTCIALAVMLVSGCSMLEQIAEYNLERLNEEREVVVDDTLKLPESTYVKDTFELALENPTTLNPLDSLAYDADQVMKLVYDAVFSVTGDVTLENELITSYDKLSEKVYRFILKEEAVFTMGFRWWVKMCSSVINTSLKIQKALIGM